MRDRQGPESEERERLERLLEWRRSVGRNRGAPDSRSLFFVVGTVVFGVVAVLLIVTLTGRSLDTRRHLASEPTPAPAEDVATVAPSSPDVGGSSSLEPSDSVGGAEAVAIEQRSQLPEDLAQPSDVAAAASPPPPPPVPAPHDPPDTRAEAVGAAASSPTPTVVTLATPTVPGPDISKDPRSETVETLKRLIGYIPEVRLGRAIVRWAKSQPPVDPGSWPLKPESTEAQ